MNLGDLFVILIIFLLILFVFNHAMKYLKNICNGNESLEYFVYKNPEYDSSTDKTVMIIAGTHGNEPAGHYAIKNLIHSLNDGTLKINSGRLILVPSVNYCALKMNLRYIPFIGDINRKYPTSTSQCEKIDSKINNKIMGLMQKSDFVLDFHEGWGFNRIDTWSIGSTFTPTDTTISRDMASVLYTVINNTVQDNGKKFRILTDDAKLIDVNPDMYSENNNIKGTLRYYANIIDKDYVLVETTGQNNVQPLELRVDQSKLIIDTVLNYFNIIL